MGYHTLFRCNLKMIRHDYPNIHRWLRHLYWDGSPEETRGAFKSTTHFRDVSNDLVSVMVWMLMGLQIKGGYAELGSKGIVPLGPIPDVMPL